MRRNRAGEVSFFERLDEEYPAVWLYGARPRGSGAGGHAGAIACAAALARFAPGQFPAAATGYSRVLQAPDLVRSIAQAPPGTFFIVMTHDHSLDYDLCRAVLLRDDSSWLGLIGSQSKGARFRSRLRRDGFRAQAIDRLVCPIGVTGVNSKLACGHRRGDRRAADADFVAGGRLAAAAARGRNLHGGEL
ncbi:MAG: XdhC family protein [Steroidobacteraceae bacterium]